MLAGGDAFFKEFGVAGGLGAGVGEASLIAGESRFNLAESDFEGLAIDFKEEVALADVLTFAEVDGGELAGNFGLDGDGGEGFDGADGAKLDRHGLQGDAGDADGNGSRRRGGGLFIGAAGETSKQCERKHTQTQGPTASREILSGRAGIYDRFTQDDTLRDTGARQQHLHVRRKARRTSYARRRQAGARAVHRLDYHAGREALRGEVEDAGRPRRARGHPALQIQATEEREPAGGRRYEEAGAAKEDRLKSLCGN